MRPLVIGIAGGTASGKTTVAHRIVQAFESVAFIDQDAYYRDLSDLPFEERKAFNFDHPDAFDLDLLLGQLRALKRGEAVDKPVYSFAEHTRTDRTERVEPARLLVLEGILVLGIEDLRRECDVKVFVDADDDVRIIRRLTRDIKERGRDFDAVVAQYFRTVRPMHYGFVEPSKRHADIIIPHGGNNEISIEMLVGAIRGKLG